MTDTFISSIKINRIRHLKDIDIPLSKTESKHLILTGKNGSGKTSVLEKIRDILKDSDIEKPKYNVPDSFALTDYAKKKIINGEPDTIIDFHRNKRFEKKAITNIHVSVFFAYFPANHKLKVSEIQHIEAIDPRGSEDFLKYMFDLDYQRLGAESEKNIDEVNRITQWFSSFNTTLQDVYDCPELFLKLERKNKKAQVIMPNREPFSLNEMADGYSALLNIVIELMVNMDKANYGYNTSGIVLVDEIEAHLHVELQKKVLCFLTTMFPNIQFIVTTHSPFVISSLENAVVFDLEKQERMEDLSAYSYSILAENYFDVDKYSAPIKEKIVLVEDLCNRTRNQDEEVELRKIIAYLCKIPLGALDTELALKLQSFKLQYPELFSGDVE
jgi:predicted ATP-dependent endonuclease of OLD family